MHSTYKNSITEMLAGTHEYKQTVKQTKLKLLHML